MARSIRLRRWQKAALEALDLRDGPDFLAVATPGAGKTTFALAAARQYMAAHPGSRLIVVAPTQHLKTQWADAAEVLDLHLESGWTAADGRLPADIHGMVTSYQQAAGSAVALAEVARDAFVVLDEIHHAGDDRAWGDGVRRAFSGAAVRLCLSGTPFRSDTRAIPFVRYDDQDLATADIEYGYGEALRDGGVVRPVHFPRTGGEMEWVAPDGTQSSATFEDALDPTGASQRLRTALAVEGEWLPDVLTRAHQKLGAIRRTHPTAGGMVIAIDRDHARGIARVMRERLRVAPTVVVSDEPGASDAIAAFARGEEPWIVAVRMLSEGVDIPRLRVGVFATTTTTELFFRQAVGRLVRWIRGLGPQPSHMFIPDDPRLRSHAVAIADQRRHSLRREDEGGTADPAELDEYPPERVEDEPQMSLFQAISAVAVTTPAGAAELEGTLFAPLSEPAEEEPDEDGLLLELAPPPALRGLIDLTGPDGAPLRPRERRRELRDANAALARQIARITGMGHQQVNHELNRRVGVGRVGEATLEQLAARRAAAREWLARA
ncbi:MAG: DEAD/DEAH box helicase [Miltoncostaeaceae bacterium]